MNDANERCSSCNAPLADDQRYCLNCGAGSGRPRVPLAELMGGEAPPPVPARRWFEDKRVWLLGAGGTVTAALLVVLGVLLGSAGAEEKAPIVRVSVPAQKAPVVNVTNTGGGGPVEEFVADWPDGTNGFTVQLETLPNTASVAEVTQAETAATAAGAADVGSLNSDDFSSLKPGTYVVYSGVYEGKNGKTQAQKALKKLRKDFPDAKVIKVSGGGGDTGAESKGTADDTLLKDLESSSGQEQQKKSAQLPEELSLGGKPPPKDNKQPEGQNDPGGVEIE